MIDVVDVSHLTATGWFALRHPDGYQTPAMLVEDVIREHGRHLDKPGTQIVRLFRDDIGHHHWFVELDTDLARKGLNSKGYIL